MLGRKEMREMVKSGDFSFKNLKVKKRKRYRPKPKSITSPGTPKSFISPLTRQYLPSTSHVNFSFKSSNLNPTYEETFFNEPSNSPLKSDDFRVREDNVQLLSDFPQCSEDKEWTRTVRSMEQDSFGAASTCSSSIECWSRSNVGSENREQFRSTDIWRKLLFPEAEMGPLLMSEEIFKENVKILLDGIDLAMGKPSEWTRLDSYYFFGRIQSFAENWSRELLKEKKNLAEEVLLAKERLKIKYDLVTNRLSLLTSVFEESVTSMKFSESQSQAIESLTRDLNIIKSKLINCEGNNSASQIASLTSRLKEKDRELEESQKRAAECREELRQTQNKLKATQTAELNGLVYANNQKTRLEQKEMQDQLSEIRSMLEKKADLGNYSSRYFSGDLTKENKEIIKDIKSLIEYRKQSTEEVEVITENIPKTADSGIKVTENEMHLVTLIASFMKVTPFPVSTEFIHLYVAKVDNMVNLQYIEKLLKKFPTFFKEEAIASGSTEKNWSYLDLKPIITI